MHRPIRTISIALPAVLAAVLTAGALPAEAKPSPVSTAKAQAQGFRFFDIKARDGVLLKANVIEPKTPGRHPAVVFTNSWGVNDWEYLVQAAKLAERGYVVLSYTTRGLYFSGGQSTVAGPQEVGDISTVIDWLIANTSADPGRVGHAGISYGAGLGLLAAAHDKRIRAVASMSAWSDLAYSLYGGQTRNMPSAGLLYVTGKVIGRLTPETDQNLQDFYAYRNIAKLVEWANARSAKTYVDALNRNRPAVMIANAYGDSFFPPNQVVDLFNRLTGPRRLELAPGDHATVEGLGLVGLPNQVWDSVYRWFDQHLAGKDTGISREGTVVLTPHGSSRRESYANWARIAKRVERYGLDGRGSLTAAPATGWRRGIRTGLDTPANAGFFFLSNTIDQFVGTPPTVRMPGLSRRDAGVWQTGPLPAAKRLRGISRLRVTVTPSAANGTLIGYLYDVDAKGTGRLITHRPISFRDARPGAPVPIDLALSAAAYDIPAGHRIGIVLDTKDGLYLDDNRTGTTITFSSPTSRPATLELPVR